MLNRLIIGEAVKHVDEQTLSTRPEVPWADIAGMRDVIAHKYFHVDLELIWDVVTKNLPALATAVTAMQRRKG